MFGWQSSSVFAATGAPAAASGPGPECGLGFWVGFVDRLFVGWWILQPPNGPDQPTVAGEADLGYRLLRRHWRRGFAGEGGRELIRDGFVELGLNRIFAQTMTVNTASRATMNAVGLSFVRANGTHHVRRDRAFGGWQELGRVSAVDHCVHLRAYPSAVTPRRKGADQVPR